MNKINPILYGVATLSCLAGILAMFAGKIAAMQGGIFLLRAETHWFNDSITAFLLSINLLLFAIVIKNNNTV
ncbi:MAG TPA: hypothetical protein VI957_02860 [Candidatus Paceibacterota bacterium]